MIPIKDKLFLSITFSGQDIFFLCARFHNFLKQRHAHILEGNNFTAIKMFLNLLKIKSTDC